MISLLQAKTASKEVLLKNIEANSRFIAELDMEEIARLAYNTIVHIPGEIVVLVSCAYNTVIKHLVPDDVTEDMEASLPYFKLQSLLPRWLLRSDPNHVHARRPGTKGQKDVNLDNTLVHRLWLFANGEYADLEKRAQLDISI